MFQPTMSETKIYRPSLEFSTNAHIKTPEIAAQFRETAVAQDQKYWAELAKVIQFSKPYTKVLEWNSPKAEWFVDGELNVCAHILDRNLAQNAHKTALLWEGEPTDSGCEARKLSYQELFELTCQISNTLKDYGVKVGDRVAIYMPMIPETVATMLACARIGAIHTVVFGGFSASALADRIQDSQAKILVTADGTYRKGNFLKLKAIADEALASPKAAELRHCFVFRRDKKQDCALTEGRDVDMSEVLPSKSKSCPAVPLNSEAPLFILYTSGTTGKPKGIFHTQAGYLLWAHWSTRWLFDIKPDDIYWCTADCGWITGHTYVTYGPLSNGATVFLYEGAPTTPNPGRFWEMIERHSINILYTAPTAIRMFMKFGEEYPKKYNLKSLRLLGSVGEPINPEAWEWYHRVIGNGKCPIVDTWWQTETGGAMIAPFPGASLLKPGSATLPLPGIDADVVNADTAEPCKPGEKGVLVIKKPWPSMARGIWGDPMRFEKTYWNTKATFNGIYVTADFCVKDEDGDFWIEGRMDDVIKVSGHRIGSAEIESALVEHPYICEAAAVSIPDPIKGESIAVFITPNDRAHAEMAGQQLSIDKLKAEARDFVGKEIGAHARPDQVRIAKALPKTRSGKIMRRLLRELAATGEIKGDTSTLEDFSPQASLSDEA